MSDSSVRVEEAVKSELDRFQGLVQAETGTRVSQSELLRRLLRFAKRHEADFLNEGAAEWRPPTRKELAKLRARVKDWGVESDASKVDDVLYGGDAP